MLSRNPFKRPFPERPFGRGVIIGHARTGAFVFIALLFLFPPLLALAYGSVTFGVAIAYHYLTERAGVDRTGRRWTMLRWTLDQAVLLLLVSVACFLLYNATRDWSVMNLRVLLYITVPTVLVGLLPIIFSGIALQLRAEGDHQKVASRVQLSSLGADAGGNGLVYARRRGRERTELHFGNNRTETVKESMAAVARAYARDAVTQCHPDYLVNLNRIVSVTADAQGLRLRLQTVRGTVPVSPAYFTAV